MGRDARPMKENEKHIQAFEAWYLFDRNFAKTAQMLATSDPPLTVSHDSLYRWREKFKWDERAKERDVLVERERTAQAVKVKVDFLNRKANYGKLLQKRGIEFFSTVLYRTDSQGNIVIDPATQKPIPIPHVNNAAVGVQVLQAGVQLEQQAMGLPEWITEILDADEDTLRRAYETAVAEFARASNITNNEADENSAFPTVSIKPLQEDSNR